MKRLILLIPLAVLFVISGCGTEGTKDGYAEKTTDIETVTNPFLFETKITETITEFVVEITTLIEKTQTKREVEQTTQEEKSTMSAMIPDMVGIINNYRITEGLRPLKISEKLCDIAKIRAEESSIIWSHTRPNGQAIDSILINSNIEWSIAGENLAKCENASAEAVVDAWMNSKSHRENLLNPRYIFCGIAEHKKDEICYISIILTD